MKSSTVTAARLFRAESIDDIAAATRPTRTKPTNPGEKFWDTNCGKTKL